VLAHSSALIFTVKGVVSGFDIRLVVGGNSWRQESFSLYKDLPNY
jgi:hypothetical protein